MVFDAEERNVSALDLYDFRASVHDLIRFCDLDFLGTCGSFLTYQIVCPPRTAIGSFFVGIDLLSRVYWVCQSSRACIQALSVTSAMGFSLVKWTVFRSNRMCFLA